MKLALILDRIAKRCCHLRPHIALLVAAGGLVLLCFGACGRANPASESELCYSLRTTITIKATHQDGNPLRFFSKPNPRGTAQLLRNGEVISREFIGQRTGTLQFTAVLFDSRRIEVFSGQTQVRIVLFDARLWGDNYIDEIQWTPRRGETWGATGLLGMADATFDCVTDAPPE